MYVLFPQHYSILLCLQKREFRSENLCPADAHPTFGIQVHPSIKDLITISDDKFTIQKSRNVVYKPAIVYSTQPLNDTSIFEVQISLIPPCYAGKLMIGVCRMPKSRPITDFNHQALPYEASNFCMWHNSALWNNLTPIQTKMSYGSIPLMELKSQDRVGLTISLAGDLAFYINSQYQGLATKNVYLESSDVYAVVTMLESCDSITVTKSGMKLLICIVLCLYLLFLIATECYIRLVDLCVAALSKCLHVASDVKLLQLPKTLADKVHTNVVYLMK